jgi:hypothetical protein
VLAELTPTPLRTLHLRVANMLEQRPNARFRMIQHVLLAGYTERALDMLLAEGKVNRPLRIEDPASAFEYLQSLPESWPETYHALIAACRSLGRPRRERLDLELQLIAFSTLGARGERDIVLELAAQLRRDTGLDLIEELAVDAPAGELVPRALHAAQQRYEATPERERGLPLLEALTALGQLIIQVIGMAGQTLDLQLLEAMPSLAPLAGLSPALAVVQENLNASLNMLWGRFHRSHQPYLDIAQRLDAPDGAGLGYTHRTHMRSAVLCGLLPLALRKRVRSNIRRELVVGDEQSQALHTASSQPYTRSDRVRRRSCVTRCRPRRPASCLLTTTTNVE